MFSFIQLAFVFHLVFIVCGDGDCAFQVPDAACSGVDNFLVMFNGEGGFEQFFWCGCGTFRFLGCVEVCLGDSWVEEDGELVLAVPVNTAEDWVGSAAFVDFGHAVFLTDEPGWLLIEYVVVF